MGVGIFSDCVFFLKVNTLPFKEKANLKTCIISNGGTISLVINEKCTHVVVVSNATLNSSQQKNIQKLCIPVVKPDFIWRSFQENQLVDLGLPDSIASEVNLDEVKDDKRSRFLAKFMQHTKTDIAEREFTNDEFEEEEDENNLSNDIEVAKYSFFQKGEEVAIVEILCFSEKCAFPFKINTACGIPGTSQKEFTFNLVDTSEKACNKYEQRIKDLKNKGFTQINKIGPEAEFLASHALQKVLLGEALNVTQLSPEVSGFLGSLWAALGHLSIVLSCPVKNISLNDVSKAEGILQNVRNALNKGEDIKELMLEFYQCIPHRKRQLENVDKKFLTVKQDLCQLIRDIVNISETNSLDSSNLVGMYRALKCRIEYVDPNTEEFHRVKREVLEHNHSNEEFNILRVFRVGRLTEATNFRNDLGNVKSLLHASSLRNIVGILSRGLLLPKIIVEEFGLDRTDIGNLGSGIYFSDSISTSVKYTEALGSSSERILLVCDVALGKTKDVGMRDYSIIKPPEGFHSLHGVRNDVWKNSHFVDDEYVVYDVNQVKMRYVVQFCTSKDTPNLRSGPTVTLTEENEQMTICEPLEDDPIEDLPESKIPKGGLQDVNGEQIPLESIHVKARIKDLAAQVVMFQTYKNNSNFPIEAKYVFPLDSTAAVCGFEAFINGKHIVGEVKEKQQAHREYRTAISQGHGAYLMDQDAPDVFTVSVGNLPTKATVIIKITYVMELSSSYSNVSFSIPGTVASWQEDQALKENTQDTVAKVGIEGDKAAQGNFFLDMSVEMPRKIENIWCSSHSIKKKQTECKAVVQVEEGSSLTDEGFAISIALEDAYIPRMWVETHPDQDSEACMLIFQPQFENWYEDSRITICLDCSNSMESCFESAKRVALLALDTLYSSPINIITFGSTYKEFYLYPKQTDDRSEMKKMIKMAKPNMGSTEFWKPLQSICLLRPSSGYQKIILISDGHLQNDNLVFQIIKKNTNHIKLFTLGVGANANKHMLRCLAKDGAGAFEYFADKSKSSWKSQMEKQNERLGSAACTAVSVKWRLFGSNPAKPMQAPANIPSLYNNDCLFVYGFVPHCTQATLKALFNDKEFENMVSTTDLQKTTGTILHKLTARAFIRDYEDGILHEKEHENEMEKQKMKSFIIKLSKEHSIVTQFTSFVAVEKRSAEENQNVEINISEIISTEDVDILPYMGYTDEKDTTMTPDSAEVEEDNELLDDAENDFSPMSASLDKMVVMDSSAGQADGQAECGTMSLDALPAPTYSFSPDPFGEYRHTSSLFGSSAGFGSAGLSSLPKDGYNRFRGLFEQGLVAHPAPCFENSLRDLTAPRAKVFTESVGEASKKGFLEKIKEISQVHNRLSDFGLSRSSAPIQRPQQLSWEIPSEDRPSSHLLGSSQAIDLSTRRVEEDRGKYFSVQRQPAEAAEAMQFSPSPSFAPCSPSYSPSVLHKSAKKVRKSVIEIPPTRLRQYSSVQEQPAEAAEDIMFSLASPPPCPPRLAQMLPPCLPPCPPRLAVMLQSALLPPPPPPCHVGTPPNVVSSVYKDERLGLSSRLEQYRQPEMAAALIEHGLPSPLACSAPQILSKPTFMKMKRRSMRSVRNISRLENLSWSSFSPLQSQEGYWMLTPQLGQLLKINVEYFCDHFLKEKGISSLGLRGKEEVLKLIATLLVLQTIRSFNLLSGITFKNLMKLDQCDSTSEAYPAIVNAVNWAVKIDRQHSGICSRLGLGRDWEHATRQLLDIDTPSPDLAMVLGY
ncbi:protein mono-ADP-ribosyltransferase PARP4 isoform X2 [Pyxicephalus adspersus]|uniref:protein mono-ADP-ribosyltransferase PARP4 isoform X2 n=1 Tax=Pyxicephalus adspersus TaxID=30357 RepID=UPI003B5B9682